MTVREPSTSVERTDRCRKLRSHERLVRDLADRRTPVLLGENHQPWRFVFVTDPAFLPAIGRHDDPGQRVGRGRVDAIAVCTEPRLDCTVNDRDISRRCPTRGDSVGREHPSLLVLRHGQAMAF